MYGCESWTIKKAEYQSIWTVILEKTLESPLDCKDIKPISPKRNQSWIFIGRTDVEAETPILWPPDEKSWLIAKDLDAGKDWRQKENRVAEDEMVRLHHLVNGLESEISGSFRMMARPLAFLLTFNWRPPPLEVQWECQDSFPNEAGK